MSVNLCLHSAEQGMDALGPMVRPHLQPPFLQSRAGDHGSDAQLYWTMAT